MAYGFYVRPFAPATSSLTQGERVGRRKGPGTLFRALIGKKTNAHSDGG
jgi:hypothetical protein